MKLLPTCAVPVLALAIFLLPQSAQAQNDCKMLLCAPKFTFLPSFTAQNLFDRATLVRLRNGLPVETVEQEAHTNFAMIFDVVIPSTIPRTSFFVELIWLPFADARENVFTGFAADDLEDAGDIGANAVILEFAVQFELLRTRLTNGWLAVDLDVIDQFGPAAQPDDERHYTHKLDLELDATFGIFNWMPKDNWLSNVKAYATLDFLVSGLPGAGDEVPKGERRFLEDASPWSFWAGLVIPVAPIAPN